ncbi:MAG: putative transcriptional regulator [Candidatus Endobugula sp.]|jgi:putative transcriptional regulator
MLVNHHPDNEQLTAYCAGSLPLSQALCIAAHIEMCAECQTNVQRLNQLGACIFTSTDSNAVVSNDLKEKVLSRLDQTPFTAAAKEQHIDIDEQETTAPKINIPKCLKQFVDSDYDQLNWQRVSLSIRQADLCTDENGAQVSLVRIKAGGKAGLHTHMGNEYTTVLKGAFSDESGLFRQGDYIMRDGKHKHRPAATKDSECICLTVLEAPIQFTGYFSSWLNPFLRSRHSPG